MDEVYHARLSATPHPPPPPLPPPSDPPIHIQPFPQANPSNPSHPNPTVNPIPIHLPNIYVNPYPAPPPTAPAQPVNIPSQQQTSRGASTNMRFGPFTFTRPHPLLWISLIISLVALVLGVPKGTQPTLTGRHKALRTQEKLVNEKFHLLSHLSHFLPPALAHLVHPDPTSATTWGMNNIDQRGLRFWSTYARDSGDRWWAVEELGEGASLVRSKGEGGGKEVWVLRMGDTAEPNRPLLSALTHSLLLRDKLQQDLEKARSASGALTTISPVPPATNAERRLSLDRGKYELDAREEAIKDEWDRLEDRLKREKERERAVEEREKEVARREKWVVEEMRQMSEKIHSQATELTLEDRITERLKSYQRQLAHLKNNKASQTSGGHDTAEIWLRRRDVDSSIGRSVGPSTCWSASRASWPCFHLV